MLSRRRVILAFELFLKKRDRDFSRTKVRRRVFPGYASNIARFIWLPEKVGETEREGERERDDRLYTLRYKSKGTRDGLQIT